MTTSRKSKLAKWTRLFSRPALRRFWQRGVEWSVAQFWAAWAVCRLTARVCRTLPGAMAFVCLYSFTGGPLLAQTYDHQRKRVEREEMILRNLGLDVRRINGQRTTENVGHGSSSASQPASLNSHLRLAPRHALDKYKAIEIGEIANLTGTLRIIEEGIAHWETRVGRDPSAAERLKNLFEQRDVVTEMLHGMRVDVEKMKANGPKKPPYMRPLAPSHKEVKPIPRLARLAPVVRPNVGEARRTAQPDKSSRATGPASGAVRSSSLVSRPSPVATGALAPLRGSPASIASSNRLYQQGNPISYQPSAGDSGETHKYFYLADALGSVTALTDAAGRVIRTYRYGAWGEDHGTTGPEIRNPYRWTGREREEERLYYGRARFYDPRLGIWASTDPATPFGNLYSYANNAPVVFNDPMGKTALVLYGNLDFEETTVGSVAPGPKFRVNDGNRGSLEAALYDAFLAVASPENRYPQEKIWVLPFYNMEMPQIAAASNPFDDVIDELFYVGHSWYANDPDDPRDVYGLSFAGGARLDLKISFAFCRTCGACGGLLCMPAIRLITFRK